MTSLTRYATLATASLASIVLNLRFIMIPLQMWTLAGLSPVMGTGSRFLDLLQNAVSGARSSGLWVTSGRDVHHMVVRVLQRFEMYAKSSKLIEDCELSFARKKLHYPVRRCMRILQPLRPICAAARSRRNVPFRSIAKSICRVCLEQARHEIERNADGVRHR